MSLICNATPPVKCSQITQITLTRRYLCCVNPHTTPSLSLRLTRRRTSRLIPPKPAPPLRLRLRHRRRLSPSLLIFPHRRKHEARMRNRKRDARQCNHHAIQRQERRLIPHSRISPSSRHLWKSVDAPDQNRDEGEEDSPTENPEPQRTLNTRIVGKLRRFKRRRPFRLSFARRPRLPSPQIEVKYQRPTNKHRHALQRNPRNNQRIPRIQQVMIKHLLIIRTRGNPPTNRLDDNAPQVAPNKDPRVPLRLQPTIFRPAVQHHMFQCQIDPRREEAGREYEAADLRLEARRCPGVGAHHQAADVARHFAEDAQADGQHEGPCSRVGADY
jgi:hypothetical protein